MKDTHGELASQSLGRGAWDEERGEIAHHSKERPRIHKDNFTVPDVHIEEQNEVNEERQTLSETILTEASIEAIYSTIDRKEDYVIKEDSTSDIQSMNSEELTTDSSQDIRNFSTDTSGFATQSDSATLDLSDNESEPVQNDVIPSRVGVSLLAGMFSKANDNISQEQSSTFSSRESSNKPYQNNQNVQRQELLTEPPAPGINNPSPMRSMVNAMGTNGLLDARDNLKKTESPRSSNEDAIDTDSTPSVKSNIFMRQQSDEDHVTPRSTYSEVSSVARSRTGNSLKRVSFDTQPPTPILLPVYNYASDRDGDDEASRTTDLEEGAHIVEPDDDNSIQSEPEGAILDMDDEEEDMDHPADHIPMQHMTSHHDDDDFGHMSNNFSPENRYEEPIQEDDRENVTFQKADHFDTSDTQYSTEEELEARGNSAKYRRFRKNSSNRQSSSHRATKSWNRVWKGVYDELSD